MKLNMLVILVLVLFACDNNSIDDSESDEILLSKSAQAIVSANNSFAFEFFSEVNASEKEDENFMVSPVSLSLALGMAYNGASGTTKDAFEDVLNYDFLSDDVNVFNKSLIDKLASQDDGSVMEIANSLWINESFPVYDEFIRLNKDYFYAEVENKDFNSQQTVDDINQWVSDKTYEKIPSIIQDISPDAVLYLINALYFNANWKYAFDEEYTYKGKFNSDEGDLEVDKMMVTEHFPYLSNDLFTSVELPYEKDKYSMHVLLPNYGKTTDDVIAALNSDSWSSYLETYDTAQEVTVELPKFKLDYKNRLNDELIEMGLGVAFSSAEADFSNISSIPTFISYVLQKTFIDVNESGTEAAAVTIIGFEVTSIGDDKPMPISFNVNKPFLYVIKENMTGSICFIGKVGAPEYKED